MKSTSNVILKTITENAEICWGFSVSKTGRTDYLGKVSEIATEGWQSLSSSTYYSSDAYKWIRKPFRSQVTALISPDAEIDSPDTFAFLTHIGPILLAVENRNGMLAASLFDRRKAVFAKFLSICRRIFEPIAPYALFSWVYGSFQHTAFLTAYKNNDFSASAQDTGIFLFDAAKKQLKPNPSKETAEEMFIRFFADDKRKEHPIEMVVAGTNHYSWLKNANDFFDDSGFFEQGKDFAKGTESLRQAEDSFFEHMAVLVQAEPYNPADSNAIAVTAEDPYATMTGKAGLSKAGYVRAPGAAILRNAFPKQFGFKAHLESLFPCGQNALVVTMQI